MANDKPPDFKNPNFGYPDFAVYARYPNFAIKDFGSPDFQTSLTFKLDAILVNRRTKTFTLDALIKQTSTKTFKLDGVIKALGTTKTFKVDADLLKTQSNTFKLDALLDKTFTKTFKLDANLLKTNTKTFTLDGILLKTFTHSFTIDAELEEPAEHKTFTIDALIEKTSIKAFSIDAILVSGESGGESGSDWPGQSIPYTKWKIFNSIGLEFTFERVIDKRLQERKPIRKYRLELGADIEKKTRTSMYIDTDVRSMRVSKLSLETEVLKPKQVMTTLNAETKTSLRSLDLQYLLEHPDKIKYARNKRLAKLALSLLNEDEE